MPDEKPKDEVVELLEAEVHDLKRQLEALTKKSAEQLERERAKAKEDRETLVKQMAVIQQETTGIALSLKEITKKLKTSEALVPFSTAMALVAFEARLEALLK